MKSSMLILSFFALGLLLGIYRILPTQWDFTYFSFVVLCMLMFSVGFSIGHQPDTIKQFKQLPTRVIFLPVTTIVGTWLGVLAVSLFSTYTLTDLLAVSSGFGYYSLSSILITQYKGVELGTIALLANIFREIFTLLLAPIMARHFSKLSPIAAGGATTMDTTFPIIIKTSGNEFGIVSIYHGFVMDFSVPFLVTLWCSM
ncbi:MAG: hypothetical protein AUK44_07380 [Porphyromonadaceae bacterium CG2_30_38_12]|nr:MAG: hypothetical protein AUK44_07380 [Porphyromonadaceae bacterium CG2_30_38_12]